MYETSSPREIKMSTTDLDVKEYHGINNLMKYYHITLHSNLIQDCSESIRTVPFRPEG